MKPFTESRIFQKAAGPGHKICERRPQRHLVVHNLKADGLDLAGRLGLLKQIAHEGVSRTRHSPHPLRLPSSVKPITERRFRVNPAQEYFLMTSYPGMTVQAACHKSRAGSLMPEYYEKPQLRIRSLRWMRT